MAWTLDFSVLWVIQGLLGDLWGKNLTVSLFQVVGWSMDNFNSNFKKSG